MLTRLLKEPLLHFAVLALVIFAAFGLLAPGTATRPASSIVVSAAKIEQLALLFAKTWQRPPSGDELKFLIDDHVAEEVLVREALALGLDQDAELQAYLVANAASYQVNPRIGFVQVFFSPDRRGEAVMADAPALLAFLRAQPDAEPSTLGDPSLLPMSEPPIEVSRIGADFGADFATTLAELPVGVWSGPVASPFGLHLVRVTAKEPGRTPPLSEVREAVLRDWSSAERLRRGKAQLDTLLAQYTVTIDLPAEQIPAQVPAP